MGGPVAPVQEDDSLKERQDLGIDARKLGEESLQIHLFSPPFLDDARNFLRSPYQFPDFARKGPVREMGFERRHQDPVKMRLEPIQRVTE
jgi:hypothetical protein